MSVPVALMPVPRMQFLDASGTPLAGGLVYAYNAGTSTPAPTYTDSTGTVLNANPVVLDAGGEAQIWLADQSYRIAVANSSNVQQWMTDNVSAYQILQGAQNITLAGVTSDPPVAAGELGYRSDLARIRFSNTAWDSIPGLATVDTFSNKTLDVTQNTIKTATNVAGHYLRDNGSNYVDSPLLAGDYPVFLPSGATHAPGAVPDPGASAGTTRFLREDATFQPITVPFIPVTKIDLIAQSAGISGSPILTPSANGFYRVTAYAVVTQAATSSSSLGPVFVSYTDADSGASKTANLNFANSGNVVGSVVNSAGANNSTPWGFYAQAGSPIAFTVSYISSGATPMEYAIHIRLEGPF